MTARSISRGSRRSIGLNFHSDRRRHVLDDGELADPGGRGSLPKDGRSLHAWRDLFEQFRAISRVKLYSNCIKPVALPPGRDRLLTRPAPTGSGTITNTIGTVRVASQLFAR